MPHLRVRNVGTSILRITKDIFGRSCNTPATFFNLANVSSYIIARLTI
jgi:hypothetical protein